MSIRLRKSDVCDDWFVIVDENGNYISDACVEGTLGEMLVLARAIMWRRDSCVLFNRCAYVYNEPFFCFYSPRNSQSSAQVSYLDALDWASNVIATWG